MNPRFFTRAILAGAFAAALVAIPAPAHAQLGGIHGRVVDESGKPVADAEVSFDSTGGENIHFTGKTDSKGQYSRGGLRAVDRWTITVTKGDLSGRLSNVEILLGGNTQLADIVLHGSSASTEGSASAAHGDTAASLAKTFADAKALAAANNFDGAITALQKTTTDNPKCTACLVRLGDTYYQKASADTADDQKKTDLDSSEKAYLAAITLNGTSSDAAEAYSGLVTLYNSEKRFDDAAKANAKQTEIEAANNPAGASGASAGGDATAAYNAGVILYNQSKLTDAEAQFAKAVQLKPDMADAHYYLGMCLVNEGKMDDAKKEMQQYLKLAPNGANAAIAKSVLDAQ